MDVVTLAYVFFFVIAFVWSVFLFLEGFDFGVGILTRLVGRNDAERGVILRAIGPNWDANEVWLLTGGILIFAAFPPWYAASFPSAYIPLLLLVFCLIVRALAIEYRSKRPTHRWMNTWDWLTFATGLLLPLLVGVFWAGMVHGIPINAEGRFVGDSLWSHINVYSVLGGLALVSYSIAHGSVFLRRKLDADWQARLTPWALRSGAVTVVLMTIFSVWTVLAYSAGGVGIAVAIVVVLAFAAALFTDRQGRALTSFWLNGIGICAFMAQIFVALFPNVLPSTISDGYTLTIESAAASSTSLNILAITALIGIPGVIAYQSWSFWVFRGRLSPSEVSQSAYE